MTKFQTLVALGCMVAFLGSAPGHAAETLVMTAGDAGGPTVGFAFDKDANPRTISLNTTLAGVAGSVLSIYVDSAKSATFTHTFLPDECRFPQGGASVCRVVVPATTPAYTDLVTIFKQGKNARIVVEDPGVMAMDHAASLIGFTKAFYE